VTAPGRAYGPGMFRKIVLAARGDDARSRDGLALAAALAGEQTELIIAGIWISPLGAGDALYANAVEAQLEHELERLRSAAPDGLFTRVHVAGSTSPARGLHHLLEHEHADLLVIGPAPGDHEGHAAGPDLALGLLHDCPCAVAVAPTGYCARPSRPPARILVGWDGSQEAARALEAAVQIAEHGAGEIRIVDVVEHPFTVTTMPWAGAAEADPGWMRELVDAAERSAHHAQRRVGGRVPVSVEVAHGSPGEELARRAAGADLIVTGSRRFGSLRRLVLGSTSALVLRRASVPVLVLPRGALVPEAVHS